MHKLVDREKGMRDTKYVVIAGDLNLPNVNWSGIGNGSSPLCNLATEIMEEGFCQVIQEGTRVNRSGKNNLLDVILVRPHELLVKSCVVDGISDHRVPIVTLVLDVGKNQGQGKTVWFYKNVNAKEVQKAFEERFQQWSEIEEDDVEIMWSGFKKVCEDIRCKLVPSKV